MLPNLCILKLRSWSWRSCKSFYKPKESPRFAEKSEILKSFLKNKHTSEELSPPQNHGSSIYSFNKEMLPVNPARQKHQYCHSSSLGFCQQKSVSRAWLFQRQLWILRKDSSSEPKPAAITRQLDTMWVEWLSGPICWLKFNRRCHMEAPLL